MVIRNKERIDPRVTSPLCHLERKIIRVEFTPPEIFTTISSSLPTQNEKQYE